MNESEIRKHFNINKASRPQHEFTIGNWMGFWQLAVDNWVSLIKDELHTQYLCFYSIKQINDLKIYCFTIWRLKIVIGKFK